MQDNHTTKLGLIFWKKRSEVSLIEDIDIVDIRVVTWEELRDIELEDCFKDFVIKERLTGQNSEFLTFGYETKQILGQKPGSRVGIW